MEGSLHIMEGSLHHFEGILHHTVERMHHMDWSLHHIAGSLHKMEGCLTSCISVVRALVCQPRGPGLIPGMSRSESEANPILMQPSTSFSCTTCLCKWKIIILQNANGFNFFDETLLTLIRLNFYQWSLGSIGGKSYGTREQCSQKLFGSDRNFSGQYKYLSNSDKRVSANFILTKLFL